MTPIEAAARAIARRLRPAFDADDPRLARFLADPREDIHGLAIDAVRAFLEAADIQATVDAHNARGGFLIDEDELEACISALKELAK